MKAHGVLSALETAGVQGNAWAAIGKPTELGVDYWLVPYGCLAHGDC